MKLVPYARHTYPSPLSPAVLLRTLRGRLIAPGSALNRHNLVHHRVFEGVVRGTTFVVSGARYGLTYGRTSASPFLSGSVRPRAGGGCRVTLVVRPSAAFLAGMGALYGGAGALLLWCWQRGNESNVLFFAFFLCVIYAALLRDYNSFYARYRRLMAAIAAEGHHAQESAQSARP